MASIREFFAEFERLSETGDADTLAGLYAPTFIAAGAAGSQAVRAADLALAIPKRRQMLESAGCSPAALASLHETALDDRYTLARATWRWRCARPAAPAEDLTVASTYLVERVGDRFRIIAYLAHGDVISLLRERGLLA